MLSDFITEKSKKLLIENDSSLGALAIGGVFTNNGHGSMSDAIDAYDCLKVQKAIVDYFIADKQADFTRFKAWADQSNLDYSCLINEMCKMFASFFGEGAWSLKQATPIDPRQLEKGIQVEMEHTSNVLFAMKITTDHLVENPRYYDYLAKMEQEFQSPTLLKEDKEDPGIKSKVADGWKSGKSVAQIEKELDIKIKFGRNSSFSTLAADMLTGNYTIG
jgi:hypothetical protein